eukprot:1364158-Prymnesium_polylepis.1
MGRARSARVWRSLHTCCAACDCTVPSAHLLGRIIMCERCPERVLLGRSPCTLGFRRRKRRCGPG